MSIPRVETRNGQKILLVDDKPFIYQVINKDKTGIHDERVIMTKWLNTVILKRTFGGQSDTILSSIRKIISSNLDAAVFPLKQIIDAYIGTTKDMRFDEQLIDSLLHIHKDDPNCRSVLMLLFPDVNVNFRYDIDHLHPKDSFKKENLKLFPAINGNEILRNYYLDSENWDTIPNLQLLNSSQNRGPKNARSLKEWIEDPTNAFNKGDLLIPLDTSLEFEDFHAFIEARIRAIKAKMAENVIMSIDPLVNELDEQEN